MKHYVMALGPVTGSTPLYSSQMQEWAKQHMDRKDIECYCLDAPDYIPTGGAKVYPYTGGAVCVPIFKARPGAWD